MIISEFRPITSGVMFEYRTDAAKIIKAQGAPSNETPSKFFIYAGLDGVQYVVEYDNLKNTLFPDDVKADCYYPGETGYRNLLYKKVNVNHNDPVLGEAVGFKHRVPVFDDSTHYTTEFKKVGTMLKSYNYNGIVNDT